MTSPFTWPTGHTSAASFTFDVDAESVVLGANLGFADRMSMMSHQSYGPRVGLPRLLDILDSHDVKATFFVPGLTVELHTAAIAGLVERGHEVAHHGYLHESLVGRSEQYEADILDRGIAAFQRHLGITPLGYRAPYWELNWHSPDLLASRGMLFDSSLMYADAPFELATSAAPIVELPINWAVDDWSQYCFLPDFSGAGIITPPSVVTSMWRDDFDATRAVGGHWILTNHPFLTGRPGPAAAFARLVEHVRSHSDVWVTSLGDVAAHTRGLGLEPTTISRPVVPEH